jgi:hypothetical protein
MNAHQFLATALFIVVTNGAAQTPADTQPTRREIQAVRTTAPISIDGQLRESVWQRPGTSGFTQRDPVEGAPPTHQTEVWVAYDDGALYVAARLHDTAPDSIALRMGRRDASISSDWFYVGIDPYHDRRTGYYFGIYPSGAVTDGTLYNDSWDDDSWDGVWDAATTIDESGWNVEMRIPYSQLRFTKQDVYVWGINFARQIERSKERSDFVMVPKKESGWVSRFADLVGIRDIDPPSRIEILPYGVSSSRLNNSVRRGDPFNTGRRLSGNLGIDAKIGLGSNMTLDATINPDFGQVEVDPAVVNLSVFETFFNEKRPFFIEGANSFNNFGSGGANNNWGFNWGMPSFFYSRRIGRPPQASPQHDGYSDVPDASTILGAGKLTGKIAEGWTLAAVSALTEREYASVEDSSTGARFRDVVEPLASYNVLRSQREFENGKRALGFIGTAVMRDLNEPYLAEAFNRRSYAFGVDGWTNIDSGQTYVVTGFLSTSRVEGSTDRIIRLQRSPVRYYQRPDATHLGVDSSATSLSGYAGRIAINKQKGNFRLNSALGVISPGFDSNDMGFQFRTDIVNMHLVLGYRWFEPDGLFRRKGFDVATFRNYDFEGNKFGEGYFLFYNVQFMNYWEFGGNSSFNPKVLNNKTTRGGPLMMTTDQYTTNFWGNSDSRNPVVYEFGGSYSTSASGSSFADVYCGIQWKPSAGVSVRVTPEYWREQTVAQWVANIDDQAAISTYSTRYVFAKLDQQQFSSNLRLDWTFNPKLTLQIFVQPLISVGHYTDFKELAKPSTYTFNRYGLDNGSSVRQDDNAYAIDPDGQGPAPEFSVDNPDFSFKSLRGNAILRWEYLPGSAVFLVWTQSRTNLDDAGVFSLGRGFRRLFTVSETENVFLLKVAYYWHP